MAPQTSEFALTLEDAKRLYEEKLETLRGQVGALERELGRHQVEVDRRREEIAKLDTEMEAKAKRLAELSDKVMTGTQAVEENKAKLIKTCDEREAKANARIEAAEAAEQTAQQAEQRVRNLQGSVAAAKADVLKELAEAQASLGKLAEAIGTRLSDIG